MPSPSPIKDNSFLLSTSVYISGQRQRVGKKSKCFFYFTTITKVVYCIILWDKETLNKKVAFRFHGFPPMEFLGITYFQNMIEMKFLML